jgi:hypothetical protein
MGKRGQYIKYDPTPEEIRHACRIIQNGWSPADEASRRGVSHDVRGRPLDRYWYPPGACGSLGAKLGPSIAVTEHGHPNGGATGRFA